MPGDHKRKARPIAPATAGTLDGTKAMAGRSGSKRDAPIKATMSHVVADGIVQSVALSIDDILTKNERYRLVTIKQGKKRVARMLLSDKAKAFREAVREAAALAGVTVADGAWRLEVLAVWPTQRHLDISFANGDADAAVSATQDALQHSGVIDNDVRNITVHGHSVYIPGSGRHTVAIMHRVDMAQRDVAIAHLLPLVPQSPEPPARPARKRKAKTT